MSKNTKYSSKPLRSIPTQARLANFVAKLKKSLQKSHPNIHFPKHSHITTAFSKLNPKIIRNNMMDMRKLQSKDLPSFWSSKFHSLKDFYYQMNHITNHKEFSIEISGNSAEEIGDLFRNLQNFKNLEHVKITVNSRIFDVEIKELVSWLKDAKRLKSLNIDIPCRVNDQLACDFENAFKSLPDLKEFHIRLMPYDVSLEDGRLIIRDQDIVTTWA
jgi:hypothetical protein